ncbi:CpsD/CapB family tyrosine-protein kinase [Sandaracinobacteroides saxicola]|uniref:CpsD/CapB family tyrosine-protein kinase n=1 Tax=Sandaracinobacteroides saxicola TaxID=2759707 RepID=A0A7G5IFC0_9SPHN|nr:CpsD/CapB family tyrosine-protein kinase [Sandaracinobacteroides saxicola]QMW22062.1 CpsD/CapB family tyrosine-protein kinase [Sandaracinobacteroides saxicola]
MMTEVTTSAPAVAFVDDSGPDLLAGDALLRTGLLTDEQAGRVQARQAETGASFDAAAVELGFASLADVERANDLLAGTLAMTVAPNLVISEEVVVLSDPASPRAEAIRLLRTQVIAQHLGAGRRAFAVTGAVDGSGASYIAANLAAALSQVGIKTLLVDANLRSPRIDAMFGLDPNGPGLTTYLSLGANRPERVVYANVLPNLSIIPAGPPVARPQELLSSARFKAGTDILLREYDVAIFDTPSANENADALTVAGVVGYALIVARRDHGYTNDVATLSKQLAASRSSVIGAVLNDYR